MVGRSIAGGPKFGGSLVGEEHKYEVDETVVEEEEETGTRPARVNTEPNMGVGGSYPRTVEEGKREDKQHEWQEQHERDH